MVLLFAGCVSPGTISPPRIITEATHPLRALVLGDADPTTDPRILAALQLTRYGVLCIVGGLIFGAVTRFRSGWGLSIAAAGLGMILLGWTILELWWIALLTVGGYVIHKIIERFRRREDTEPEPLLM